LELVVSVPEGLPPVRADRARIEQVLLNLIHNAIKFTPAGGRVTVAGEAGGGDALSYRPGHRGGIAEDEVPRIFETVLQGRQSPALGGHGLGLAIAKHIVQAHGGTIGVQSRQGDGTSFRSRFPWPSTRTFLQEKLPAARS
jgi:two-component system phosphate regulon sensor histidine kinase PhoR